METNQRGWNTVLRQAVIQLKPDYFELHEIERDAYRLHLTSEDDFRIRQTLLKALFGIAVGTSEELDTALETFDDGQYLLLNSTLLPFQGIGKDHFFMNEYLPRDVTLLDFDTVGDYARDDHRFQEQARKQENSDDPAKVDALIEQEKRLALDFLANTYQDIMDNFDPTIVKLHRKRKVILANEKLKDK